MILSRLLLVAGCGALGASCRYLVGIGALKWVPGAPFVGTLTVNLLGCFVFGVISQLGSESWLTPALRVAILTGFLGAFTTFSAFSYDTLQLVESRGMTWAVAYVLGTNTIGIALALAGMSLTRAPG